MEEGGQPILLRTGGTEKAQWVSGYNKTDPVFQKEPDTGAERKKTKNLNLDKMVEQPVYFELLVARAAQARRGLGRGDPGGLGSVEDLCSSAQQAGQESQAQRGHDNQQHIPPEPRVGPGRREPPAAAAQLEARQLAQRAGGGKLGAGAADVQQGLGRAVLQPETQVGEAAVAVPGVLRHIEDLQLGQVVEGARGHGAKAVIGQQEVAGVGRQGGQGREPPPPAVHPQPHGFQGLAGALCGALLGGLCGSPEQQQGPPGRHWQAGCGESGREVREGLAVRTPCRWPAGLTWDKGQLTSLLRPQPSPL